MFSITLLLLAVVVVAEMVLQAQVLEVIVLLGTLKPLAVVAQAKLV
tara:strand:+ start:1799 stop:1936 length:138 start_codon:yes stop_codon:yes gene_type:complete